MQNTDKVLNFHTLRQLEIYITRACFHHSVHKYRRGTGKLNTVHALQDATSVPRKILSTFMID